MCAVILIHCQAEGNTVLAEYYQIVLRQIINFAVAVFIFMSGYFAKPYKLSGGDWYRLKKLLIPYIVWSVFYSVINGELNPINIMYLLVTGKAEAQLYYIIVLIELMLLTPLLINALDNWKLSVLILSITPIYLLLCTGYRYITGAELTWMGRDFCAWIIFYYTGMLVRRHGWKQRNTGVLWSMYLITLVFSITEGVIVNYKLGMFSMAIGQINVTTMLNSLAVIALTMNYWIGRKNLHISNANMLNGLNERLMCFFCYIGDISFGIYFCHIFVLKCVSFVLRHIGLMEISPLPLIQLTQFFLTLIGSVVGIYIIWRVDVHRKICSHLGF